MADERDKPRTSYLPETKDPLIGTTVAGRYLVEKKLGEGGMGGVYLAMHTLLEKHFALKVLHGEFARKPELVERFMQEAKSASRIQHENVIEISDFGTTPEGLVFFAMELLQGHDLHEEIVRARRTGEPMPWTRTKKIFLQICAALSAAHARGIVHRDLKPENVYLVEFLGDPDFVKLLDFGIAKMTEVGNQEMGGRKLTKTGMLFGTPEYMSPEQARGEPIDQRIDIYAMGCLLFQLVTGRLPFEADNFMGVLSLHLTEAPPVIAPETFDRICAPRALADVIDRALDKDRDTRWQTIDELAKAVREVTDATASLRKALAPKPVVARATTAKPTPVPARAHSASGWTGRPTAPDLIDAPLPRAPAPSRVPLVIAAVVTLGGAGAAYYLTTRDSGEPTAASGSAASGAVVGSAVGSAAGSAAGSAVVVEKTLPPPEPKLPDRVTLVLDSLPHGATVKDLSNGKPIGKTPFHYEIEGSKEPRQFAFHLHGYGDTTIELVPNRETIEYVEKLEKGARAAVVHQVPDTTHAAGSAAATGSAAVATGSDAGSAVVAHPDAGSGSAAAAAPGSGSAAAGSAAPKPPDNAGSAKPEQKCNDEDVPCLKSFGSGS